MADGSKRERVIALLGQGLTDEELAIRPACSRGTVVAVRKDLGVEQVSARGGGNRRDRVEQAIARGLGNDAIARQLGEDLEYVVKVRAAMDRAVARDEQGGV